MFKKEIIKLLKKFVKEKIDFESLIEIPPNPELGDFAFPCFTLAKAYKKNPTQIAKELSEKIKPTKFITKIQQVGPYLNFFINEKSLAETVLKKIFKEKDKYGSSNLGKNKTVVIDFSSPNIAKPFAIAHLRSTMIGNSIYKTLNFLGYKCVGINHLGDWGTQFGKLIVAYKNWGKKSELEKEPIKYLLKLYVKFHEKAEKNKKLEDEARRWFSKLELGDKEATKLWKTFRELSLKEFKKLYKRLNVKFASYAGEAFYNPLLQPAMNNLKKKKILQKSEGATVVKLENFGMPPCILKKSDGATTYATRDLAAAIYRRKKYKFDKMLYVVDMRQSLHFKQIFKVFKLAGFEWYKDCFHINFGLMKFATEIMSTRKGKVIFLEEVLDKAANLVKKIITEKNPKLKGKEAVAEKIGVGAITFWDLSHDRTRDITFDWDKVLDFEGETGPYIQYAHSRANSIIKKAKAKKIKVSTKIKFELINKPEELKIIKLLSNFHNTLIDAKIHYKPSILARYALDLAQAFNEFYHSCQCLAEKNKDLTKARLLLISATKQTLKNSLNLLGIGAPEAM